MKVAAFMSASSGLSGCAPAAVNVASASAAGAKLLCFGGRREPGRSGQCI